MILLLLAYLGGVLTIISPCILPVLPFVFARADRPFLKSGLPMLLGMAASFALVATAAAVAGGWAVAANQWGRYVAMTLLAVFGLTLLLPGLADRMTRPLVALGGRLSQSAEKETGASPVVASLLLGVATGLLWAPCAGPILGLILTGAALNGANARTSLLLLAYALGAATSLGLALLVGGRVFAMMKRALGAGEWIRRGLGVLVLAGVAAIALGLDTGLLTKISLGGTNAVEQGLLSKFMPGRAAPAPAAPVSATGALDLPVEGPAPSLDGAVAWLNSPPLTMAQLKGKVVLVDFWTYSCINCLRAIPYVEAWAQKYKDKGLVVIGVHTPEFAFERNVDNVKKAVGDLKITYPVAVDSNDVIWRAFNNDYWPAHYFIDAQGRIRRHHFGEGGYDESERVIQALLTEAGAKVGPGLATVNATGVEAAANIDQDQSPETYVGYDREAKFASPGGMVPDARHAYAAPAAPALDQWGLAGDWTARPEYSQLDAPGGAIVFRFHARDLHLVMGPSSDGKPARFKVTVDGAAPGADHGVDTDAQGRGVVTSQRLYQLVRQHGAIADHTFRIQFLDAGVQAFSFTFG